MRGGAALLAVLLAIASTAWASERSLQQAASGSAACQETSLLLPTRQSDSIRSVLSSRASAPGISQIGVCMILQGSTTLVQLNTGTLYRLQGTVVFWWQTQNSTQLTCHSDTASVASAARDFFLGLGFLTSTPNWSDQNCCTTDYCAPSDVTVLNSPSLNTSPTPNDWVVVENYTLANGTRQGVSSLSLALFGPTNSTRASAEDCRVNCSRTPGCASFTYLAGACTFYQNEPAAGTSNWLVPCTTAGCVTGWRIPGSCGRTSSASISWFGYQLDSWAPKKNTYKGLPGAGDPIRDAMWAMNSTFIPDAYQGLTAASSSECACRCGSQTACVAYVWQASDSSCWMLNQLFGWTSPIAGTRPEVEPLPDTVIGRVFTSANMVIRDCSQFIWWWQGYDVVAAGSSRITIVPSVPANLSFYDCYDACASDPACMSVEYKSNLPTNGQCFLFSEATGGFVMGTNMSFVPYFKRCDTTAVPSVFVAPVDSSIDWTLSPGNATTMALQLQLPGTVLGAATSNLTTCTTLCQNTPGCGGAIYNANNPACTLTYFAPSGTVANATNAFTTYCAGSAVACNTIFRTAGFCGLTASSGIIASGRVWGGNWTAGAASGTWGGADLIEPSLQGTAASSASDCHCRCAASATCVTYVFLGAAQTCWLQSSLNVTAFNTLPDISSTTVVGRLELAVGATPACTATPTLTVDRVPSNPGSALILRSPATFAVDNATACNAACLAEPFCQGFSVKPIASGGQTCSLYSSGLSSTTTQPGTSTGAVQRCALAGAAVAAPPPAPSASQPPPAVVVSPQSDSSSGSKTIGIAVGVAVGGVALLGVIAGLLIWRRRRRGSGGDSAKLATARSLDSATPTGTSKNLTFPLRPPGDQMSTMDGDSSVKVKVNPVSGELGTWPIGPVLVSGADSQSSVTSSTRVPMKEVAQLSGIMPGDPFMLSVAPSYKWSTLPLGGFTAIEEGINAASRAASVLLASLHPGSRGWALPAEASGPPPVRLSAAQVQQQIEIMARGKIDRGATAVVFKCRWPATFGPKALLAIKMLRDPHGFQASKIIEAFKYEAEVLARCRHPNVVRMYAYCLEPPNVCIIMELLPGTLKRRLYPDATAIGTSLAASLAASAAATGTGGATATAATNNTTTSIASSGTVPTAVITIGTPTATKTETGQSLPPSSTDPTLSLPTLTAPTTPTAAFAVDDRATSGDVRKQLSVSSAITPPTSAPSTFMVVPRGPQSAITLQSPMQSEGGEVTAPPSVLEVLQLGVDIATGLAHLHSTNAKRESELAALTASSGADPETPPHNIQTQDSDDVLGQMFSVLERVVHRDLKPANVLLNSAGRAKIADFGLAREHDNTSVHTEHIGAGTLRYMAPELMGGASLTDKVDIYSLGIILWELAAREVPWKPFTDTQLPFLVQSGQRPPLSKSSSTTGPPSQTRLSSSSNVSNVSQTLVDDAMFVALPQYVSIIKACWQNQPHRRPTAASVRDMLIKILKNAQAKAAEEAAATAATKQ